MPIDEVGLRGGSGAVAGDHAGETAERGKRRRRRQRPAETLEDDAPRHPQQRADKRRRAAGARPPDADKTAQGHEENAREQEREGNRIVGPRHKARHDDKRGRTQRRGEAHRHRHGAGARMYCDRCSVLDAGHACRRPREPGERRRLFARRCKMRAGKVA